MSSPNLYLADPESRLKRIIFWTLGSFAGTDRVQALPVILTVGFSGGMLGMLRWRLNLLSLGETDVHALGIDATRLRWFVIALVSLIVAAQVSVSGGIGLVGLIIPHAARMMAGPDHRRLLPVAALSGAIFLLGVDDVIRWFPLGEIPIGLLTAFIGTPIFGYILWQTHAKGWSDD